MTAAVAPIQAVILAGGRGDRLRPLTDALPKPMAPVNGTPFLDYLLKSLVDAGIRSVLLLVGYRSEAIIARYAGRSTSELSIQFSVGTADDQTGRRLLNAAAQLESRFLLVYGDTYWPVPLAAMSRFYQQCGTAVSTTVFGNRYGTGEYGPENNVEVNERGIVVRYDRTRTTAGLNGVDIGYFIVDRVVLDLDETANVSFEQELLPPLIARQQLAGFVTDVQYHYLTDLDCLKRFEQFAAAHSLQPLRW